MVRKRPSSCGLKGGSSNQAVTPLLLVCSVGNVQVVFLWAGKEVQSGDWTSGQKGGCVCRAWPEQASAADPCGIKCCPFCMARDNWAGKVEQGRYKVWRCAVAQ